MFDPISGKGSIGERVLVEISDFPIPEQWLPVEMLQEALLHSIIAAGSIHQFVVLNGFGAEEHERVVEAIIRLRILYDFPFWAALYVYIKSKGGGEDVKFYLNFPQRKLISCFEEQRKRNEPIRLIVLKARQWGG